MGKESSMPAWVFVIKYFMKTQGPAGWNVFFCKPVFMVFIKFFVVITHHDTARYFRYVINIVAIVFYFLVHDFPGTDFINALTGSAYPQVLFPVNEGVGDLFPGHYFYHPVSMGVKQKGAVVGVDRENRIRNG